MKLNEPRQVIPTTPYKKDLKSIKKQKKDLELLKEILNKLRVDEPLPQNNLDHNLKGSYHTCRECHITPDWLLIYEKIPGKLVLHRTGSHAKLFEKNRK
ncbi:MAG: type II toxin-antitoxin system mRNA interferase toxin, RelE/StbE family [Verrucomicrobia bacterium CG_4_10_14_3_um_filter_43_23]|nr:MAG: hypothetical protein AUJ82_05575 [Verrucomicrobia bacterium CG1_02_43_26]PIP58793.1 MAG: type II toxin-antitoxin system mRNA interferase toxin, RelE/StbE family [Verrucomicrobia bacterium CG22_combo_CG10-13_8_21_14_all_43_17]PIX58534.1 MAG: type II toxin-antitoxin system mRNA interferase toxin, RelE/StbE family [Verrucomicrobia bacterium CG_4_10_14_3_um_filter_43_23]PIY61496.1 MAG: type II toxin-antitoxin system mRNA interferase toxin, RelE/StbE family [Verrucomicrobia bacterium CG_4_10_